MCFKNAHSFPSDAGIAFQDPLSRLVQDLLYAWNDFVELLIQACF